MEERIHITSLNNIQKGESIITYEELYKASILLLIEHEKNNEKDQIISSFVQEEKEKISREFRRNFDHNKFNTNIEKLENILNDSTNFMNSPIFLNKLECLVINKIKVRAHQNNQRLLINPYLTNEYSYENLYNAAHDLLLEIDMGI